MSKTRTLFALLAAAASLLALSASAYAQFERTNGTSGESNVKPAGKALTTIKLAVSGASFECTTANFEILGWKIQEPNEKSGKVFAQKQVPKGPDEVVHFRCLKGVLKSTSLGEHLVELTQCFMHVQQPAGLKSPEEKLAATTTIIGPSEGCNFKIPAAFCELKLALGVEGSPGKNFNLSGISDLNAASGNTMFSVIMGGIEYTSNCLGVESPGKITLEGELELFGQKVV
jgi:hypothetical protein